MVSPDGGSSSLAVNMNTASNLEYAEEYAERRASSFLSKQQGVPSTYSTPSCVVLALV